MESSSAALLVRATRRSKKLAQAAKDVRMMDERRQDGRMLARDRRRE